MTRTATNPTPLHHLLAEIHVELLDDCGDWDAAIPASDIVDCAINGDWCDDGDLERAAPNMTHGAREQLAMKIAATFKNVSN